MSTDDKRFRVLVVDDSPDNVDVLVGILGEHFQVSVALNGYKALSIIQSDTPPDLVLLDVIMPDMDGYELCRRIQEYPDLCDIPIIFVTSLSEVKDEVKGFSMGAVDFILKPFSPPIVLARVRVHLLLRDARYKLEGLLRKLSQHLSPQVYLSIFERIQENRLGNSPQKSTVFMSGIVDFSRLTASLNEEELAALLTAYRNCMGRIALAHGGTLDKCISDAIFVFFGQPHSKGLREDAVACVSMAVEMRAAVHVLSADWKKKGVCKNFEIRMGISTGLGGQVSFVNRLLTAANPGEILVGPETITLVFHRFRCLQTIMLPVKGAEESARPYRVIEERFSVDEPAAYDRALGLQAAEEKHAEIIEDSRAGFTLEFDPEAILPEDRRAVIAIMHAAIASLREV